MSAHLSPEVALLLLVLALFLLPRFLQRFRLPAAITSVGIGAALGLGFQAFQHDPTLGWLGTLGIVALFLFAGLEVDFDELRRGRRVVLQHIAIQTLVLAIASVACAAALDLSDRVSVILALALFTPSTGFIMDSLGSFGLDGEQKFWVKTKAIATEIVALAILFFTVQSSHVSTLALSTAALLGLVAILPLVFRVFSTRILPHAPRSEFTFLVVVAVMSAYLTRKLGVYYLVGAFVVGITAVRMRASLPGLVTEKVLGAVELFASFFVPFYFLKAGLHLERADFTLRSAGLGLSFVAIAVPVRVLTVALHRKIVLGEPVASGARVGLSLVPTLVFTLVLADMLVERFDVDRSLHGALVVFALVNTMLPGFLMRARLEIDGTHDAEPTSKEDAAIGANGTGDGDEGNDIEPPVPVTRRSTVWLDPLHRFVAGGRTRENAMAIASRGLETGTGTYWVTTAAAAAALGVGVVQDSLGLALAATLASPVVGAVGAFSLGLASAAPLLTLRGLVRTLGGLAITLAIVALVVRVLPPMSAPALAVARPPTLFDLAAAFVAAALVVTALAARGSNLASFGGRAVFGHAVLMPLAVTGHALATGEWTSFARAVWSTLASLSATVVASLVGFVLLGFATVDPRTTDGGAGARSTAPPWLEEVARRARTFLAGRRGMILRVAMPALIVAAAAIPLYHALESARVDERTRSAVRAVLDDLPTRVLDRRVTVRPTLVSVQVTQVGDDVLAHDTADQLRRTLRARLDRPVAVDVVSVPDAVALEELALQLRQLPVRERESIAERRRLLRRARELLETRDGVDHVLGLEATTSEEATTVRVTWIGEADRAALSNSLVTALEADGFGQVQVVHEVYPRRREVDLSDLLGLGALVAELQRSATIPGLAACLYLPDPDELRSNRPSRNAVEALTRSVAADGSAVLLQGEPAIVYVHGVCAPGPQVTP